MGWPGPQGNNPTRLFAFQTSRQSDLVYRDMVRPQRSPRRIRRRIHARKRLELVGKVLWIIEAAIEREFRPAYVNARMQLLHGALKPLQSPPHDRRQTH